MPLLTDPFNKTAKHWVTPKQQVNRVPVTASDLSSLNSLALQ